MKVLHNALARIESASKIQDLFASSFYEVIGLKLRIFPFVWQIRLAGSYMKTYFEDLM